MSADPSVDAREVAKFAALADQWWDEDGPFRPLHRLNPVRLGFIRDHLAERFGRDIRAPYPLKGLRIADIGLIELNEAFAAQSLGCIRRLGLDPAITNVNGGAIALGHPTGCSGARILTTLIHEMKRRAKDAPRPFYGLATLCVGVGQGVSTIVEWIGD